MGTRFRQTWRIVSLLAALSFCLPFHLAFSLIGRPSPWPRHFLTLATRAVGVRPIMSGTLPGGRLFLLSNHVSWVDILVIAGATGAAFVAHDGIARWPLIGWLARQNGTLFVARGERGGLASQIAGLRALIDGHQPVALFPEGTTGDGTSLLPFKPSLLAVLYPPMPGMRVQPVHLDYGANADIAWVGDEPAVANAMRVLGRKGTVNVTLRLLPAFDPADCPDRKVVAQRAREAILASIATHAPSSVAHAPV